MLKATSNVSTDLMEVTVTSALKHFECMRICCGQLF